ncbi:MAG: glycoside hydrolase family 3 N-terminal domain-containing protein [Pseudomonadota bacterium]
MIRPVITIVLLIAIAAASNLYSPFLLKLYEILLALPILALTLMWVERRMCSLIQVINFNLGLVLLAVFAFSISLFYHQKHIVQQASTEQLERLGRHIIVGYRDLDTISELVERGGVGGIFITRHNVYDKTLAEVRQNILRLQNIQRSAKRRQLWIAANQEGGIVTHLSPPLSELPPLSSLLSENHVDVGGVVEYGKMTGNELSKIGVNLNLAPVVDLRNVEPMFDRFSLIAQRALSDKPALVAEAARHYARTLETFRIMATLKHFPGLGRVNTDTHFFSARLTFPLSELANTDWLPFKAVLADTQSLMMLGHVILPEIDPHYPASYSKPIISGLIRNQWQHDGILISDDFSMAPIYYSEAGIGGVAIKAMNAGLDLILIAYDERQYYPVMAELLIADKRGLLDAKILKQSRSRLDRMI